MIKTFAFRVLLFIYFSASYLGAVHIHHDSEENYHDDCQVCVLTTSLHSGDIPLQLSILCQLEILFLEPSFTTLPYTFIPTLSYQAQAPPHTLFV